MVRALRPSLARFALLLSPTLLAGSLLAAPPQLIGAGQCKGEDCGEILIGRPKLWSLADAQYHVGRARQRLKELRVALPNETLPEGEKAGIVDPNAVHIRQLDLIMQSLGIEVKYDQKAAIENQQALARFRRQTAAYEKNVAERDQLQARINEKSLRKKRIDAQLEGKTADEGDAQEILTQAETAITDHEQTKPTVPEDPKDAAYLAELQDYEKELARLRQQRAEAASNLRSLTESRSALSTESVALKREIDALTEQRNALGTLEEPDLELASTDATAPDPAATDSLRGTVLKELLADNDLKKAIADRVKRILTEDAEPHYIHQLNNFVDGHLQTISKRLTLLRQSVDPNFDLYFMEASASLTPSRKTKRHIARARWRIVDGGEMDWGAFASRYVSDSDFHRMLAILSVDIPHREAIEENLKIARDPCAQAEDSDDPCAEAWKEKGNALDELAWKAVQSGLSVARSYAAETDRVNHLEKADGVASEGGDGEPEEQWAQKLVRQSEPSLAALELLEGKSPDLGSVSQRLTDLADRATAEADATKKSQAIAELEQALADAAKTVGEIEVAVNTVLKPLAEASALAKSQESDPPTRAKKLAAKLDEVGGAVKRSQRDKFRQLPLEVKEALLALGIVAVKGGLEDRTPLLPDVKPYLFEMTPTQAALNIARNQHLSKRFALFGKLSTILGFGGAARYERQRETYRQFLQQQVFIAGQGKGASEFGWDFSALPGDKWVAQGAYTAYGVLAVPKYRRSIQFKTNSSWLLKAKKGGRPRADLFEHEDNNKDGNKGKRAVFSGETHEVFLPSRHDYWVNAVYYDPVPVGEEISVILRGKGFSNETTVLVNNTPLDPRWRLIDPGTSDFSYLPAKHRGEIKLPQSGGERKVHGAFELMSSDTIAMRFRLPGFSGIPQITLLSPHRSIHVTDMPIRVNNDFDVRLDQARKAFLAGKSRDFIFFKPKSGWLSIAEASFLRVDDANQKVDARLRTTGIDLASVKDPNLKRPKVEAVDSGAGFEELPTVHFDSQEGLVWLYDAPTHDGYLTIKITEAKSKEPRVLVDRVPVPFRPSIGGLAVKTGPAAGKTQVEIRGKNLAHVAKVFFGDNEAKILTRTDHKLLVSTPAGKGKVKVRAVSRLKRDDMELASAETNHEFQYVAPKTPAPRPPVVGLEFTSGPNPADQSFQVTAALAVDLNQTDREYLFKAFDGSDWKDVSHVPIGSTQAAALTAVPTHRGKVTVRLWEKKDGKLRLLGEKGKDAPLTPELETPSAPYSAPPGATVILKGRNLQLVTTVSFGGTDVKPTAKSYDQVVVDAPKGSSGVTVELTVTTGTKFGGGAEFRFP